LPIDEDELYRLLHIPKPNPDSESLITPEQIIISNEINYPSPIDLNAIKKRVDEANADQPSFDEVED